MRQNLTILVFFFILGGLSAFSMAPYNFWPILFVGLSTLYYCCINARSAKKATLLGFWFSFGYFVFGLSWIGNALLIEDNPYWWAWPLAVSGLPLILSLFYAVACYIYKKICGRENTVFSYLLFTGSIFIAEYLRGHTFSGFPWNLYGYTWAEHVSIRQSVSLSSIYLLTYITLLWACFPVLFLSGIKTKAGKLLGLFIVISSFAGIYGYGQTRIADYNETHLPNIELVLVQPNVKQHEKWDRENLASNFMDIIKQSEFSSAVDGKTSTENTHVVIWPETTISQSILDAPWARKAIANMLMTYPGEAYLITGALRYEKETEHYFNSILVFDKKAKIQGRYNKSHLVPFGEYIPLGNIIDIAPIVGFSGFQPGNGPTDIDITDSFRFSPLICYEIIFPQKTVPLKAKNKVQAIVNVTNDAWYGDSAGPRQHLTHAQFRAIEKGIPTIRVANTGISAVFNPLGYSEIRTDLNTKITATQKIPNSFAIPLQSNYIEELVIMLLITSAFIRNYTKFKRRRNKNANDN